jgi:hypothetical protein
MPELAEDVASFCMNSIRDGFPSMYVRGLVDIWHAKEISCLLFVSDCIAPDGRK